VRWLQGSAVPGR